MCPILLPETLALVTAWPESRDEASDCQAIWFVDLRINDAKKWWLKLLAPMNIRDTGRAVGPSAPMNICLFIAKCLSVEEKSLLTLKCH